VDLLLATLLAGLAAAGAALLLRITSHEFPIVERLLSWRHGKPIGCATCVGGWVAFGVVPLTFHVLQLAWGWAAVALVWAGAVVVAAILQRVAMPQPPPVNLDELLGEK
jgi:hypothetical protein